MTQSAHNPQPWSDRVVAEEIRAEMARQRRTTISAAHHFGVTASTIRRKLLGSDAAYGTNLSVADLVRFADWLGVSASDLLARAEAAAPKRPGRVA